jgi:hypothetical protein
VKNLNKVQVSLFNYTVDSWQFSVFGHNLLDEDGYGIGFDVADVWSFQKPGFEIYF